MDQERFKCILSLLERHELTLRERQFVEAVEKYLLVNGKVTDQQESVLEGIYKEKMWVSRAFRGDTAFQLTGGGRAAKKKTILGERFKPERHSMIDCIYGHGYGRPLDDVRGGDV